MKKRKFFSISYKIFLFALLISIVPMATVGVILYQQSSEVIKKGEGAARLNSLSHISTNIEMVCNYVDDLSVILIQDDSVRDWLRSSEKNKEVKKIAVQSRLSFCIGNKGYISAICLEDLDGSSIFTGSKLTATTDIATRELADEKKGRLIWVVDEEQWQTLNPEERTIAMFRNVNDINTGRKLGTLRIEILISEIADYLADEIENAWNVTYLTDSNGKILASGGRTVTENRLAAPVLDNLLEESSVTEEFIDKELFLITTYHIPDSDWFLVNMIPTRQVLSDSSIIKEILSICLVLSLFLCMIMSILFSKIFTKPLVQLSKRMQIMDMQHIDMTTPNDEIGILLETYNNMSYRLEQYAEEMAQHKIALKEAEFSALQAQINPHALYNNLDTAYWMSRLEKATQTGQILLALSRLYRLSIGNPREVVSVQDELEYLNHYLVVQKARLEDSIQFDFDVANDATLCRTLRFILQPIVENSILHGIIPKGTDGIIKIKIYLTQDELVMEITDNGVGADSDYLNKVLEQDDLQTTKDFCFAIKNVHNRIKLSFGNEYGLHYETKENGETLAIIRQPKHFIDN